MRGRCSQAAFSRYLGFSSSVVHRWEAGKTWPTAATFLQVCQRCGRDLEAAFTRFFHRPPTWLEDTPPASPAAVAALLQQLRGKTPIVELAQNSEFNRYTIARWLKGSAQPSLPEFLSLVQTLSRRLLDLVAALIDPTTLPSVKDEWERLQRMREAACRETWSHAVLRALETSGYREAQDADGWLAAALGIDAEQVKRALDVLATTEQIARRGGHWVPSEVMAIATGSDPSQRGILTEKWSSVALDRMRQRHPGHYGYSLLAASRADLRRIRELHVEYLRAIQRIIANSEPSECVGLLCLQLLDLSERDDNALAR
jgi:transcriptional regulator with XRE-family HTH domain